MADCRLERNWACARRAWTFGGSRLSHQQGSVCVRSWFGPLVSLRATLHQQRRSITQHT